MLRLLSGDVRQALAAALAAKRQELVRFIEGLWDKYAVTLETLRGDRAALENSLREEISKLGH